MKLALSPPPRKIKQDLEHKANNRIFVKGKLNEFASDEICEKDSIQPKSGGHTYPKGEGYKIKTLIPSKEIQPVHPKGDQSWVFFRRNDVKLKLQYFGHIMRRADSLEKTLMLGGIGGRR